MRQLHDRLPDRADLQRRDVFGLSFRTSILRRGVHRRDQRRQQLRIVRARLRDRCIVREWGVYVSERPTRVRQHMREHRHRSQQLRRLRRGVPIWRQLRGRNLRVSAILGSDRDDVGDCIGNGDPNRRRLDRLHAIGADRHLRDDGRIERTVLRTARHDDERLERRNDVPGECQR